MTTKSPSSELPADHAARAAIVAERARNVAVVAGAGTGKTKTIIDRAVELLAPRTAGAAPVSIKRLAALTFTRRAAGELRFRIREQLLRDLEHAARTNDRRVVLLRDALSNLDAAFIGTIHGFADRLLRLRPVEAKLSPAYALVEDTGELVRETFSRLRRAAEAGNLAAALGPSASALDPALLAEAAESLRAAARAGLQMERAENAYGPLPSVEAVLASMIDTRDVDFSPPAIPDPGVAAARSAVDRLAQMVRTMRGRSFGHDHLRRLSHALRRLHDTNDAAEAFRVVQDASRGRAVYKRDFDNDSTGWSIYGAVRPDNSRPGSLAEQLRGPQRWLAVRLVRLFPVLRAMYERVKDEHEVVDYLDLLVKLRNVLRDNREARGFYQGLFDHIFVDEFQDTDPLQCEIVFFLCEDGVNADRWDQARLAPGKLTIVGDPKQSIYRFRRADIVMYDRATQRLQAGGALEQRLDTNFRSRPELITFYNQQLDRLLGHDSDNPVDAKTGRANYEPLTPAPTVPPAGVCVHALPYAGHNGSALLARDGRAIEAVVVARYVRWLLNSGREVRDPDTGAARPLHPGDVAVLASVTTNLPLLLAQFDGLGIEYSARGGTLFLAYPLARQYLLALRALADRDDGVALAALLAPPFFALDCADLVAGRASGDVEAVAYHAAGEVIRDLRARRHQQSPGATARDLIERTALGRAVVTGRNGRQALAALYEIAWELDRRAALDHLDYAQATELVRAWADAPVFLDAPEPLGESAVRVMSIHQAKGLEFPVVILWDGFQTLSDRGGGLWRVERDGAAWALSLGPIAIEQPPGSGLIEREKVFGESERRRMYYVAATRARDLLVLPLPLTKSDRLPYATKALAEGADPEQVERFDLFRPDALPIWAQGRDESARSEVIADAALQTELDERGREFALQLEAASEPIAVPIAITAAAKRSESVEDDSADSERARKAAGARFGNQFGIVVHRALELLLSGAQPSPHEAVSLAARENNFDEHAAEALADVERALAALDSADVTADNGWQLCCEYPVYDVQPGTLLSGFIDLLAVSANEVLVIDFKSDQPRDGDVASAYPAYAAQLRLYGEALEHSGRIGKRKVRLALLLTATGELRWLD
ncbi:MAG: UvrD-helicase domain-containing protein [Deltaproteobacteria bacterium]|nr:UvrD-helicase domain-containing protein [Deltaproteobacteria bacterium]MBI3387868.1 UvrD-helicase domain-containing protein [Deltaproteobacteria bacterium]